MMRGISFEINVHRLRMDCNAMFSEIFRKNVFLDIYSFEKEQVFKLLSSSILWNFWKILSSK